VRKGWTVHLWGNPSSHREEEEEVWPARTACLLLCSASQMLRGAKVELW
jgi:hypothetical protein